MADDFGKRFPPSITAAKLYEKTSAKGNAYLTGRLGGLKVAIIKTTETGDDGSPIWELKFSQAAPAAKKADDQAAPPRDPQPARSGFGNGFADAQRPPAPDDVIPY